MSATRSTARIPAAAITMTPERWERVKQLFEAAQARSPAERAAFLATATAGDEDLRREVQRLLDQPIGTQEFLQFVGGAAGDTLSAGPNLAGQQLGSFQVKTLLGRGGMGEVYLAHDTKLGRDVAIKVLPRAFTEDAGRLTNFEREARVVASLNHPNIAAIHGVEESDGIRGLV
ncbi:MAG TPA: protein kinase, partial [Vicinamibacterales bacterium]|nr:protein kinase [Vicinamibacterales bacterium]